MTIAWWRTLPDGGLIADKGRAIDTSAWPGTGQGCPRDGLQGRAGPLTPRHGQGRARDALGMACRAEHSDADKINREMC